MSQSRVCKLALVLVEDFVLRLVVVQLPVAVLQSHTQSHLLLLVLPTNQSQDHDNGHDDVSRDHDNVEPLLTQLVLKAIMLLESFSYDLLLYLYNVSDKCSVDTVTVNYLL